MSAVAMTMLLIAALFVTTLMVLAHRAMERPSPWVSGDLTGSAGDGEHEP